MLLLPNFQRSFGFFRHPIFDWGAKVRAVCIQTKFFFTNSEIILNFLPDFSRRFIWRTSVFFERIAKIRAFTFTANFFFLFCPFFSRFINPSFKNCSAFFQTDCKDKGRYFISKIFSYKILKNFCLTRLIIKNLFPFFFKSGCKDNQPQMITKFNCKRIFPHPFSSPANPLQQPVWRLKKNCTVLPPSLHFTHYPPLAAYPPPL